MSGAGHHRTRGAPVAGDSAARLDCDAGLPAQGLLRGVHVTLRNNAHAALTALVQGLLTHPGNAAFFGPLTGAEPPPQQRLDRVREAALIYLYRLLFLLEAEAKNLLPMKDAGGAPTSYARQVSTAAIHARLSSATPEDLAGPDLGTTLLRKLFRLLHEGSESHGLGALGGGLFDADRYAGLAALHLTGRTLKTVLDKLVYLDGSSSPLPYARLDVRALGDVYEGLLALRVVGEVVDGNVSCELRNQRGEKKASGSFYTPDELVDYAVRRALEPLLDACGNDVDRILQLRVVDPAMGSGHFLVKAVEVIAGHLASHCRTDPAELPVAGATAALAWWKRKVVERCMYGVDDDPMAVELARLALWLHTGAGGMPLSALERHLKCGNALTGEVWEPLSQPAGPTGSLRLFHWRAEFPEVAFLPDGRPRQPAGFDAVVGNPPWDKLKPAKRDFWGRFDADVADRQGPSLQRLVARWEARRPDLAADWRDYEQQRATIATFLAERGGYRHQVALVAGKRTGGDPDLYRYFLERATQLCKPGGRIAQIVPSSLWQAEGCTALRRLLLQAFTLEALYTFENYRKWAFPIDSRFKFSVLVGQLTTPQSGHTFPAAFMLRNARPLTGAQTPRRVTMSDRFANAVSPATLALLDVRTDRERALTLRLHEQHPALGSAGSGWNTKYHAELHMTHDAWLFKSRDWMQKRGFTRVLPLRGTDGGWRQTRQGPAQAGLPDALPDGGEYWMASSSAYYRDQGYVQRRGSLWGQPVSWFLHPDDIRPTSRNQERMEQQHRILPGGRYSPLYEGRMVHNFDHAQKAYLSGEGRRALWAQIGLPDKRLVPRCFVCQAEAGIRGGPRVGFCDVTGATNERSLLASVIPASCPCGNKVPTLACVSDLQALVLGAILNSFVFDALLRQRISTTVNWVYLAAVPIPSWAAVVDRAPALARHAARLSCTTPELASVWSSVFPDLPWTYQSAERDPWRRAELRAGIDAMVAGLYGLRPSEFGLLLTGFPLLDRDQASLPGDAFVTEASPRTRVRGLRGQAWDEVGGGLVQLQPRSFVTRDLALLRYCQHCQTSLPGDLHAWFRDEAGMDPEGPLSRFRVGSVRPLEERVIRAREAGAVAYLPSSAGRLVEQVPDGGC